MKMKRKYMTIILGIIFVFVVFITLNYKSVKLSYIGNLTVSPPVSEFNGDALTYFCIGGKYIKKELEKNLFPIRYADGYKLDGQLHPVPKKYKIVWEKDFTFENEAIYYVGLGCEIEMITYFSHSKYFNTMNDPSVVEVSSVSLKPIENRSIITIYKGDVMVVY